MKQLLKLLVDNRNKGFFKSEPIVNVGNQDEATIYLYDMIVSDDLTAEWCGGVSPQAFVIALSKINAKIIHLRINSPGGDVFAARAIEQALKEHSSKVIAHIDGVAASAASFLAMAADEIVMNEGAFLMIHKASTLTYGNSDELIEKASLLEKIDDSLANTYSNKSGKSKDDILQWMADETWFSAQEAIDNGLADQIFTESTAVKNDWNMSAYKNSPTALIVQGGDPNPEPSLVLPDNEATKPAPQNVDHLKRKLQLIQRGI